MSAAREGWTPARSRKAGGRWCRRTGRRRRRWRRVSGTSGGPGFVDGRPGSELRRRHRRQRGAGRRRGGARNVGRAAERSGAQEPENWANPYGDLSLKLQGGSGGGGGGLFGPRAGAAGAAAARWRLGPWAR